MEDGGWNEAISPHHLPSSIFHSASSTYFFLPPERQPARSGTLGPAASSPWRRQRGQQPSRRRRPWRAAAPLAPQRPGAGSAGRADRAFSGFFLHRFGQFHLAMTDLRQAVHALGIVPLLFFLQLSNRSARVSTLR